jgi:hypothetical protein
MDAPEGLNIRVDSRNEIFVHWDGYTHQIRFDVFGPDHAFIRLTPLQARQVAYNLLERVDWIRHQESLCRTDSATISATSDDEEA